LDPVSDLSHPILRRLLLRFLLLFFDDCPLPRMRREPRHPHPSEMHRITFAVSGTVTTFELHRGHSFLRALGAVTNPPMEPPTRFK